MPRLSCTLPSTDERRVRVLTRGDVIRVGRDASDIVLPEPSVDEAHARIVWRPQRGWLLIDQGSEQGTFVNGVRIHAPVVLHDGDRIRFGGVPATFSEDAEWYYGWGQEYFGPVAEATLEGWYAAGQIDASCYVWRDGDDDWRPLLEALPRLDEVEEALELGATAPRLTPVQAAPPRGEEEALSLGETLPDLEPAAIDLHGALAASREPPRQHLVSHLEGSNVGVWAVTAIACLALEDDVVAGGERERARFLFDDHPAFLALGADRAMALFENALDALQSGGEAVVDAYEARLVELAAPIALPEDVYLAFSAAVAFATRRGALDPALRPRLVAYRDALGADVPLGPSPDAQPQAAPPTGAEVSPEGFQLEDYATYLEERAVDLSGERSEGALSLRWNEHGLKLIDITRPSDPPLIAGSAGDIRQVQLSWGRRVIPRSWLHRLLRRPGHRDALNVKLRMASGEQRALQADIPAEHVPRVRALPLLELKDTRLLPFDLLETLVLITRAQGAVLPDG